jgi:hypothetical protein
MNTIKPSELITRIRQSTFPQMALTPLIKAVAKTEKWPSLLEAAL